MASLADLLTPAAVAAGAVVSARKPLITVAADLVAAAHGLDPLEIADRLAAREQLGSTGFGGGVAIPHAKLDGLAAPVGAFVRLGKPVAFGAVDHLPVDLVFVLISPSDGGAEHLKVLARVSRTLRDAAFVAKLRGAGSADALYALLAGDHG